MDSEKFYNTLSLNVLESFAKKTFGKNPSSDFEQIMEYINPKMSVLEIGTGTGRIGIELIKKGFNYTGIEREARFLDIFKSKLQEIRFDSEKVDLIQMPFEDFPKDKKYDIILFSWSVLMDFSKEEQGEILKKSYNLLLDDGVCIIDNPSENQKHNEVDEFTPTLFHYNDWTNSFDKLGFNHESKIYKTKTNIERELIILRK